MKESEWLNKQEKQIFISLQTGVLLFLSFSVSISNSSSLFSASIQGPTQLLTKTNTVWCMMPLWSFHNTTPLSFSLVSVLLPSSSGLLRGDQNIFYLITYHQDIFSVFIFPSEILYIKTGRLSMCALLVSHSSICFIKKFCSKER